MATFPGAGETFGRYDLLRLLGRGGMGVVYEARQRDLGRLVALKLLNPEIAEESSFRSRFQHEARIVANLDSPHVIQVYDAGEHDGVLFIATQLIHGRDLMGLLNARGALDDESALRLVADVASALADAHEAGILHRDVKPANVLVRESTQGLYAYLCDFGIARQPDSTLTRTSGVLGTPNYMAPEAHSGATATPAFDIYSLGCVLWASLSAEMPYTGKNDYQVALAHVEEQVPQVSGDTPATPAVNEILRRSMAKAPEDRYGSANEMRQALLAAAALASSGVPTAAVLPPPPAASTRPPAPDPADTRAPTSGPPPPPPPPTTDPVPRRRPGRGVVLAALGLAGLVVGGIALAAVMLGDGGARDDPGAGGGASPSATGSESAGAKGVQCGDGSTAAKLSGCPVPTGSKARKISTVFPSLDGGCFSAKVNPKADNEISPVFRCEYGTLEIRYSTWLPLVSPGRREYFASNYGLPDKDAPRASDTVIVWEEDDTALSHSKDEERPYLWAATYAHRPYSVIVKAESKKALRRGIAHVRMAPEDEVPPS